ncbi:EF-hand domain-containing protein [Sphingobium bisphenolivorans]|uniref:EF-hand domain-containing protein n=1 Tax=Sphingobium bisphenolivorans TaxID=1335760 RepID=UPI00039A782A|nr:EF-hand domain-containing protein [Sphingobium bisphenolivorans]
MIRKFMTTVALGSLFVGGLAASHLALAQDGPRPQGRGGMLMMADANKDGAVTKAELTTALNARFAKLDANRDGKLDTADRDLLRQQRLDARFAALDTDKNGQISKAEFTAGHQERFGRGDAGGRRGGPDGHHGRGGHHGLGRGMMFGGSGEAGASVTREQFLARPIAMFDKADTNKDGKVTADEMKAARQAMRDSWKGRKGPTPPPAD